MDPYTICWMRSFLLIAYSLKILLQGLAVSLLSTDILY